jgi:type I restriction enzyme M protein
VNEVTRERAQSFLEEAHIQRIVKAYRDFAGEDGFARLSTLDDVRANQANLSIPLYVRPANGFGNGSDRSSASLPEVIADWQAGSQALRASMDDLFTTLQATDLINDG